MRNEITDGWRRMIHSLSNTLYSVAQILKYRKYINEKVGGLWPLYARETNNAMQTTDLSSFVRLVGCALTGLESVVHRVNVFDTALLGTSMASRCWSSHRPVATYYTGSLGMVTSWCLWLVSTWLSASVAWRLTGVRHVGRQSDINHPISHQGSCRLSRHSTKMLHLLHCKRFNWTCRLFILRNHFIMNCSVC